MPAGEENRGNYISMATSLRLQLLPYPVTIRSVKRLGDSSPHLPPISGQGCDEIRKSACYITLRTLVDTFYE